MSRLQRPGFQADQHELFCLEGEWLVHDGLQRQEWPRPNPCQSGNSGGCSCPIRSSCLIRLKGSIGDTRQFDCVHRILHFRERNQLKYLNLPSNQDLVDSGCHSRDFVENQDFLML